jgi:hypothetical protein
MSFILRKLHKFDEFCKKFSEFSLPHIIFVAKVNGLLAILKFKFD